MLKQPLCSRVKALVVTPSPFRFERRAIETGTAGKAVSGFSTFVGRAKGRLAIGALIWAAWHGAALGQDNTVAFSTASAGVSKSISVWGASPIGGGSDLVKNALIYMGADQIDLITVAVPMTDPPSNGTLSGNAATLMTKYLSSISALPATTPLYLSIDTYYGVDSYYKPSSTTVDPDRWSEQLLAAKQFVSRPVGWIQPFNEPDFPVWQQGTPENLSSIMGVLTSSADFSPTLLAGPATGNVDDFSSWYGAVQSYHPLVTTHSIFGTVANYVSFLTNVKADGEVAFNPELHNVSEAIIGAEYGLGGGVWWRRSDLCRGNFVKACQGARLGYFLDADKWTAAAVYRGTDGNIQAFLGGSEQNGVATNYRFYSKDRDVFYDGYGPRRDYTVTTGLNLEQVVNITWGSDVPPPVTSGTYIIVNRNSGLVMGIPGGSTTNGTRLTQDSYAGAGDQQWLVSPYRPTAGKDYGDFVFDLSYFTLTSPFNGKVADDYGWSYTAGGAISQWDDASNLNQNWFFRYAGNGFFYIRNRWSGKYLDISGSSTAPGATVVQSDFNGGPSQQWRLMPAGADVEFVAPAAPAGLAATANAVSVTLTWNANAESDLAGYTIFRSVTSGGPYDTIARGVTTTSFTDKGANRNNAYHYVIKAVDRSLNQSAYSNEAGATPTGGATLVAKYDLDGSIGDSSGNANDATVIGAATYGTGRVGTGAIVLDGAGTYASLPAEVANHDQITIAAWVYWNGGGAWQRIFDFGNDTSHYMFLTPNSGSGMRFSIVNGGAKLDLNAPALATGKWVHVAVTLGNQSARLYVDGVNVDGSDSATLKPSDFMPAINYLGRSQYAGDPLFSGKIDDFQIYNYVLGGAQIADLANAAAPPASIDPLAHLKFDETTGATAVDATGNGWSAALVDSPTWVSGTLANAVWLSGTASQHLKLPPGIVSGLGDFTISTWVKPTSFSTWQRIFDFGTGTTNYMFLTTQYTGTSPNGAKPRFDIRTSTAGDQVINSSIALTANVWNHIAVTLSGNTATLYVNGTVGGTNTAVTLRPSSLGNTTQNYLGRSQWSPDPYLNGSLDDFRIYSRALSAAEVAALAAPAAGPTGFGATPDNGKVSLAWNAQSGATSYNIYRTTVANGPYTLIASRVSSISYDDVGLTNGTTYYYVVTAVNGGGESANSTQAGAIPLNLLQTWRLANFGTTENSGAAADDADPDTDGRINKLEYATGGNPNVADAAPAATMGKTEDATRLTLKFHRIADPSLTYEVVASDDLSTWQVVWSSTGSQNLAGDLAIPDVELISAHPRRFLKLRISHDASP